MSTLRQALSVLGWTKHSSILLNGFILTIFLLMSLTIITHADLRTDGLILFVGIFGGFAIESWGTTTRLNARRSGSSPPSRLHPYP